MPWSKEWLLPFYIDKYNILHFGKNNHNNEYNMDEKLILASCTIKDLGIILKIILNVRNILVKLLIMLITSWELLKILSMNKAFV